MYRDTDKHLMKTTRETCVRDAYNGIPLGFDKCTSWILGDHVLRTMNIQLQHGHPIGEVTMSRSCERYQPLFAAADADDKECIVFSHKGKRCMLVWLHGPFMVYHNDGVTGLACGPHFFRD